MPKWTKEYRAQHMREKRAKAKTLGIKIPSDDWAKNNPDKHREKTARWRAINPEKASQLTRDNQKTRRSTPWGKINNRMWTILHQGVRSRSTRVGKYTSVLGYEWRQLSHHLESQFSPDMAWENWGSLWELDHIKPLVLFKYETIDCPSFKAAWALSNLRPLLCELNQKKGVK